MSAKSYLQELELHPSNSRSIHTVQVPKALEEMVGWLGIPLLSMPGPKILYGVGAGTWAFLSSADMDPGVLLEFPQGSQSSSRSLPSLMFSALQVGQSTPGNWHQKLQAISGCLNLSGACYLNWEWSWRLNEKRPWRLFTSSQQLYLV